MMIMRINCLGIIDPITHPLGQTEPVQQRPLHFFILTYITLKNIKKRGSVPETTTKKKDAYHVGPIVLGFFIFVVIGSYICFDSTVMGTMGNETPRTRERHRTYWTLAMERYFVDMKLEHMQKGNRSGHTFSKQAWNDMLANFMQKIGSQYDNDVLKCCELWSC